MVKLLRDSLSTTSTETPSTGIKPRLLILGPQVFPKGHFSQAVGVKGTIVVPLNES